MPFALKKNFQNSGDLHVNYPLKKKYKLISPNLKSNNFGIYNGKHGNRNINLNKKDIIRINCLGGSTTMNYLKNIKNENISYPIKLEKKLNKYKKKKKYEVNNFGQGLYNSTDVLVKLLTNSIYTKPDIILLYIGYNDIRSYLTNNFQTDHTHSRKSLNFTKLQILLNYISFDFHLNFLNYLLSKFAIYNIKDSLTEEISKGKFNLNNDPSIGLKVFSKNIEFLIIVCKAMNIRLIMGTFCHYLYKEVEKDRVHKKFNKIVKKENQILKNLARKYKVEFVDNEKLINKDKKFFVDSIHFSVEGMDKLAENYFNQIIKKK